MKKAVLLGVLLIMVLALTLTPSSAQSTADPTWVKMLGYIDSYGEDVACGLLRAYAKVGEWARVHAFYVPGLNFSQLKIPRGIPINFTFSFHAVRLVNSTEVKLNYAGNDLYISGLWNVYNVTFVYYGWRNFTWTREVLVDNGAGELNVTAGWRRFTLGITGIEVVEGKVFFFCIVSFKPVPIGDVNCDHAIDILDVVSVAIAFGSTPGISSYDFNVDLNFDFHIDIVDVVTVVVNFGKKY